ncbi:MAG: hypothetical protein HYZ42_08180 [Bacteroidetes bacterium]|nr:hypothetical protein [Bacteroidota bacterium]
MKTSYDLIKSYCNTLKSLFERHGVNFDRITDVESIELLEESVSLSERILRKFHLPNANSYIDILPWEGVYQFGEYEIHQLIARLEAESKEYFNEVLKPDLYHLKESAILGYGAQDVLMEMGLPSHIYLEFVYNMILCKNCDSAENVLLELRKSGSDAYVLKNIALAGWSIGDARERIMKRLDKYEVNYLQEFLDYQDTMQYRNVSEAIVPVYVSGKKALFIEKADYDMYLQSQDVHCICVDFEKETIEGPDSLRNMLITEHWFNLHPDQHDRLVMKLMHNFDREEIFSRLVMKFYEIAA